MKALKTTKRRLVQKVIESTGSKSADEVDADFKKAVDNFKTMEHSLKQILDSLKSSLSATKQLTLRNASLGKNLYAFFISDESTQSLSKASQEFSNSLERSNQIIQPSAQKVLSDRALQPIQNVLNDIIPSLKKRIKTHQGTMTDVNSYKRRVATKKQKGVDAGDPDLVKLQNKLDKAQAAYDAEHEKLKNELIQFYNTRHEQVRQYFIAICACQVELQEKLAIDIKKVLSDIDHGDVRPIREEISQLINSGGPSPGDIPVDDGTSIINKNKFSGMFKKQSTNNMSPKAQQSSSKSLPPTKSTPIMAEPVIEDASSNPFAAPADKKKSSSDKKKSNKIKAKSNFKYEGGDDDDLSFEPNEIIVVTEKVDDGWWLGYKQNDKSKKTGLFPSNYVTEM